MSAGDDDDGLQPIGKSSFVEHLAIALAQQDRSVMHARTPKSRPARCCTHASCGRITLGMLCERHRPATDSTSSAPAPSPAFVPSAAEEVAA